MSLFKKVTGKSAPKGSEATANAGETMLKATKAVDDVKNVADKAKKLGKFAGAAKGMGKMSSETKGLRDATKDGIKLGKGK